MNKPDASLAFSSMTDGPKPKVRPVEEDSRGILRPAAGLERFRLDRFEPGATMSRFVDRYWCVRWDLPDGVEHRQEVLSHPVVNVVFEAGASVVEGVLRERDAQVIEGRGIVLGVMFRAGGFSPFLDGPLTSITDVRQPVAKLFGSPGEALEEVVVDALAADAVPDAIDAVESFFAPRAPAGPHPGEEVSRAVELAAADPAMVRVADLARVVGVGERQLQRLFADHVGVNPKWVIRRYRLYEAADAAAAGTDVNWAGLAAELGYSDQAHLTRDFTKAFGLPPDRYARTCT